MSTLDYSKWDHIEVSKTVQPLTLYCVFIRIKDHADNTTSLVQNSQADRSGESKQEDLSFAKSRLGKDVCQLSFLGLSKGEH